jgi:hypothetical protein
VLLCAGLTKKYFSNESNKPDKEIEILPDVSNNSSESKYIQKAVKWDIINVYPDKQFKPDLDLSWAEVIISVKKIINMLLKNTRNSRLVKPMFTDLPNFHPLYDGAAMATSMGIYNNLSKHSYTLSESVTGIDAIHVINNLNRIIEGTH